MLPLLLPRRLTARLTRISTLRDGDRSGSIPFARCLVAGATLGATGSEQVVMWGGCGSLGHGPCPANDVWRYDQRTRTWDELSKCPGPRNRASMAVWPTDTTTLPPSSTDNGLDAADTVVLFGGSGGIWGSGNAGEVNLLNVNRGVRAGALCSPERFRMYLMRSFCFLRTGLAAFTTRRFGFERWFTVACSVAGDDCFTPLSLGRRYLFAD